MGCILSGRRLLRAESIARLHIDQSEFRRQHDGIVFRIGGIDVRVIVIRVVVLLHGHFKCFCQFLQPCDTAYGCGIARCQNLRQILCKPGISVGHRRFRLLCPLCIFVFITGNGFRPFAPGHPRFFLLRAFISGNRSARCIPLLLHFLLCCHFLCQ